MLAVLAGWQLRHYSAASDNAAAGIDPVLALAPALALVAGSVATLRLLPPAARMADRLAARGRNLTASLASWQLARMPVRQAGAALLLTMAVATGTLAFAQHASWLRSASDQAAFATGADVQIDPPGPLDPSAAGAVATARGVTRAMPVAADDQATPSEVLAIDAAQAAPVVRLRGDQSPLPPARLFAAITPAGGQPGAVVPAPPSAGTIRLIQFTGARCPRHDRRARPPVALSLTVIDRTGAVYQVDAGTLVADGRPHPIVASVGGGTALYPLRVAAITATFPSPVSNSGGPELDLTLSGLPLSDWTEATSSGSPLAFQPSTGPTTFTRQAAMFFFDPGSSPQQVGSNGRTVSPPLLLGGQLRCSPARPRSPRSRPSRRRRSWTPTAWRSAPWCPRSWRGRRSRCEIVAEVASFPTVTAPGGALITDLGSLQEYLLRRSLPLLPVSQWWLATADGGVPPSLTAGVPAGTDVTSAGALAVATAGDTLSAAPQQAVLAMAAAAAALAITGFWVSIAADVRRRRGEAALLAALGVTRREAAVQLCLEKLLLSLPAAALGVLLGTLVAWLLVPAVTLTAAAQLPTPPTITVDALPQVDRPRARGDGPARGCGRARRHQAARPRRRTSRRGSRREEPDRPRHDTGGGRGMSVLRRLTGLGSAGCLALALLAGGGVLAATVGPRQAQATANRSLAQTLDAVPPVDKNIVVSSSWSRVQQRRQCQSGDRIRGRHQPDRRPTSTTPPPSCAVTSTSARFAWRRNRPTGSA